MRRSLIVSGALVAGLLAAGCAKKVEVQSDGCWAGRIGSSNVDACGNNTYTMHGDPKCAILYLKGPMGNGTGGTYLRARIQGRSWSQVNAQFDSVVVCQ
ncbi:MAG TPA: hypothetical protein VFK69_01690 [Candidatus Eisenbacteria bacterium]|nr:hypothetical protein [Candidatus Eisenbacteria bacterium]